MSPEFLTSNVTRAIAQVAERRGVHAPTPPACNGMPELCDRRYDQVVYPTTHNSTAKDIWFIPNQDRTIEEQLNDGIRGFMIDLWYWKDQVYTCHRFCELGGQPLLGVMQTFQRFLKNNPNEVVSIIFENYVSGSDLNQVFFDAGLLSYVHMQPTGQPWPTLRQMISSKRRLVIFKEFEDDGPDWDMNVWRYAVETPFSYDSMNEFTCDFSRGQPENPLYIVNQFLSVAFLRREANRRSNQLGNLLDRAHRCFEDKRKIPNFLAVDFYTTGDVIQAAQKLNEELSSSVQ